MSVNTINTPDLGGTAEVTVIEVLVKPGDVISTDTQIVTLESDKATMDIPSPYAGKVKTVNVKVGDKVAAGAALITIDAAEDQAQKPAAKPEAQKPAEPIKEAKPAPAPAKVESPPARSLPSTPVLTGTLEEANADVHAGPYVRRFARELGVNLAQVSGTGPKQRILKDDVQAYVKAQLTAGPGTMGLPAAPVIDFAKFGTIETQPLSRIKKISGKNLQRNWMMIPHVTQFGSADITDLEAFRVAQKGAMDKQNVKLTILAFIMKATVASLKAFPTVNASLDASGENLVLKQYFHIGVAVDTPDGLVVPVIRDVDQKGVVALAKELAEVSEKARKKQLTPLDMQGGCFSISSLGGIGGTAFTPIINAPEVAILGVSKSSYQPVYQSGQFVPRLMLPLSLSYDHRVIDGAEGARFITHLSNMLSDLRHILL